MSWYCPQHDYVSGCIECAEPEIREAERAKVIWDIIAFLHETKRGSIGDEIQAKFK